MESSKLRLFYTVIEKKLIKHITKRNFDTKGCKEKSTTEMSEFRIASGELCLSPIVDMYNGKII